MPRVLLAGLPGTGKSTLARALADAIGGLVLNKDQIRAAVFPDAFTLYSVEQDDFVLDLMIQAAAWWEARRPDTWVFFDGRTFSRRYQRDRVAADRLIWCDCPAEVVRTRLAQDDGHPAADRDFALYERVRASFEPLTEPHWRAQTDRPLTELTAEGLRYLKA